MEQGWISVDEYMPVMRVKKAKNEECRDSLESDYVLVWDGSKAHIANAIFDGEELFWMDRFAEVIDVALWMYIPTPPKK